MLHPRQVIRHAVVAQLAGKTAAGARVFPERGDAYERSELPAIAVYAPTESTDAQSWATSPRELDRRALVVVEAALEQNANTLDAVDALCLEIENALHADWTLGGAASDLRLTSTEMGVATDGRKRIGAARLEFEVRYYSDAVPAGDFDDFKTVDARHGTLARDTVDVQP